MTTKEREWLTVGEFYERYKGKIGRNTIYERIRDKTIPHINVGRRILIPSDALDQLLINAEKGE